MAGKKEATFAIINKTRNRPALFATKRAGLLYKKIKDAILGKKYKLSLVFIGEKLSKTLNKNYRGKNKPTDILSFPLSKNEGEIFINLKRAKIESRKFKRSDQNFLLFLLIHGCCHLKGLTHSSKMEAMEKRFRDKFEI